MLQIFYEIQRYQRSIQFVQFLGPSSISHFLVSLSILSWGEDSVLPPPFKSRHFLNNTYSINCPFQSPPFTLLLDLTSLSGQEEGSISRVMIILAHDLSESPRSGCRFPSRKTSPQSTFATNFTHNACSSCIRVGFGKRCAQLMAHSIGCDSSPRVQNDDRRAWEG